MRMTTLLAVKLLNIQENRLLSSTVQRTILERQERMWSVDPVWCAGKTTLCAGTASF